MSTEPMENPGNEGAEPDESARAPHPSHHSSKVIPEQAEFPQRPIRTPPIDIYEGPEGLVLTADLPGVTVETLDVQVQDNRLTILGRVPHSLPPDARALHQEFEAGDFLRSFILSDEVDHDRIVARLNNGVLEVVLPKAPKTEPRRIQVNRD